MTQFRIEMQGEIMSEEIGKYSESKQNFLYKTIMLTTTIKKSIGLNKSEPKYWAA